MALKIALVDVGTWNPGFHGRLSSLDPLGIEYLGAILVKHGYDVKLFQKRSSLEELVAELKKENVNVLGISSLTVDINNALKVAQQIKGENNKIKTVVGGYHATAMPDDLLKNEYIDFVVLGEGEIPLLDLMNALSEGKSTFDNIPNLGWKTKEGNIKINKRDFSKVFDFSIWPLREKRFLEGNKIYGVVWPPISQHKAALITYSRNCPYNCSYCASPWLFGRKVRYRNPEDVANEMIYLRDTFGVNLFYFTDLTFNSNRKKVEELCDVLKGKDLYWYAMCSADSQNIDEELISRMKESGMTRILFGLESFSEKVLKGYRRRLKKGRVETFDALLRICDKYGIATRCSYMIGEINETESDLKTYLNLFKQICPDEISIKIITPFPGTPLFEDYKREGRLLAVGWDYYDIEHLVFRHPSLSEDILKKYQYEITKQYFESDEYRRHVSEKIKKYPYLEKSFLDFFERLLKINNIDVKL
jgi:radical SAM superfamily enzyme YgiQ (UPF0313 family)